MHEIMAYFQFYRVLATNWLYIILVSYSMPLWKSCLSYGLTECLYSTLSTLCTVCLNDHFTSYGYKLL